MPKLSCFTPCGMLRLSSRPSPAELFYRAQVASLGRQFSTEKGTHVEASVYARAMGHARAQILVRHAGDQDTPTRALELIPERELEYGIVPGARDTIADRRAALATAKKLPRGAAHTKLEEVFGELLGDDFISVRATPSAEAVTPFDIGVAPQNLQLPSVARKFIRILDGVCLGIPGSHTVRYEALDPNEATVTYEAFDLVKHISGTALDVGDVLVIDAEHEERTEKLTVTAVGVDLGLTDDPMSVDFPAYRTFTAVFRQVHDDPALIGAPYSGTTIPWPAWPSSKRHMLIVLSAAGILDQDVRSRADAMAARIFPSPVTWSLTTNGVGPDATRTSQFLVGEGRLGMDTIGRPVI